jgi:epoxyqueuosine reductase
MSLEEELKDCLCTNGASLCGFGDLSKVTGGEWKTGVSVAVVLPEDVVRSLPMGPTREYREAYDTLNARLDGIVTAGAEFLLQSGFGAFAQTTGAVVEREDYRTALPHKTVATRAGLGWIGKCALLVTPEYGPAVRLSSLVTDAPLTPAEPIDESRCGDCMGCRDVCPGKAVSGKLWKVGMAREEFWDAYACRRAARALAAEKLREEITLCGRCIAACPYTKRYLQRESAT